MYTCIYHVNILCIGTVCLKLTERNMPKASCSSATICISNKILYAFIISSMINTSSAIQIVFTLTTVIISDEENKLLNLFHNPLTSFPSNVKIFSSPPCFQSVRVLPFGRNSKFQQRIKHLFCVHWINSLHN